MKKLFATFLLLSFSLFMLVGCGKFKDLGSIYDEEEWNELIENIEDEYDEVYNEETDEYSYDDSNEDPYDVEDVFGDNNDGGTSIADKYVIFESSEDILNRFSEFGYTYSTRYPGEDASSWSLNYESLGKESIDGIETDHIIITKVENGETDVSEVWYDDSWNALKAITFTGDELTGADASLEGSYLTMMLQIYNNSSIIYLSTFSEDGSLDEFSYEYGDKYIESIDLGLGSVDMELQDLILKFANYNRCIGSVPMEGKEFLVVLETYGKEDDSLDGLRINRAIPR